jgi:pSer/pThr/pTyr-binding forkhead associated (FHA) protein
MSQLLLSALAVVCPNCDGYNPPRAEGCASCGTSLFEAPPTAKPPPSREDSRAPSASRPPSHPGPLQTPEAPPGLRPSTRTPLPVAVTGIPLAPSPRTGVRGPTPTQPMTTRPPAATVPPAMAPRPAATTGARPLPAASRFGLMVVAGSARGQRFKLPVTGCGVGRSRGAILFGDDPFVSAQHATFFFKDNALYVRDETSASGVYVTIPGAEPISPMSLFSVGQRLFRFLGRLESPQGLPGRPLVYGAPVPPGQGVYSVEEMLVGGRSGRTVATAAPLLTIGKALCDFCYPQDEELASRHCELSPSPAGALLRDLSGGLGTYVRIPARAERLLRPGDRVRVGQHILQVELLGG